jgi:hypothetical protein
MISDRNHEHCYFNHNHITMRQKFRNVYNFLHCRLFYKSKFTNMGSHVVYIKIQLGPEKIFTKYRTSVNAGKLNWNFTVLHYIGLGHSNTNIPATLGLQKHCISHMQPCAVH